MPHLVVIMVALPCGDGVTPCQPSYLGMSSGNDDMNSVMTVTLRWQEGGQLQVVHGGFRLKGGSNLQPPDEHQWCGADHRRCHRLSCQWRDDRRQPRGTTMISSVVGKEEKRRCIGRSTGWLLIVQPSPSAVLAARQSMMTSREGGQQFRRPGRRSGRSDGGPLARREGWNRIESHGQRERRGRKEEDGGEEEQCRSGGQVCTGIVGAPALRQYIGIARRREVRPASPAAVSTALLGSGSSRATMRRRAGGRQRCTRTGNESGLWP